MTADESAWLDTAPWGITPRVAERLQATATEVAHEWGVPLGERLVAGRFSFVAFAGEDAVLKVVPIEDDEADHEADALELLDGDGAVRLLRRDRARRAILIERARPGFDASHLSEREAIRIAVSAAQKVWRPAEKGRPFLMKPYRRVTSSLLAVVGALFVVSCSSSQPKSLTILHTNDIHASFLPHEAFWLKSDPKPMVGEPEFDVPTFLWNPIGHLPTRESVEVWISAFAEAGLDANLLRKWAIVRGTYQGLPLSRGLTADTSPQLRVVRALL